MKLILLLLGGLWGLGSCTGPAHDEPVGTAPRSGDAPRTSPYDTLHVAGGGVLHLRPTTEAAFRRVPADSIDNTNYEANLSADTGRVCRRGFDLLLYPTAGRPITLRSEQETVENPSGYSSYVTFTRHYTYCGELPGTHQWLVYFSVLNQGTMWMIDQHTGQRNHLLGQPLVSPDKRHLLSVSTDPDNDGSLTVATGIQLYQLGKGAPRLLWTRDPEHWGALEARWAGPRTVLLEQDHTPPNQGGGGPPPTYAELTLP